jgi:DNA helicase-2/ATP-dependent DNA helicase PcrA
MPLSNLNEQQYKSATSNLGYNLTIASAGTGKTSTIVGRIAHLLNNGTQANHILLLTFTNKAAQEMIERVGSFFSKEMASKIVSGTFHSVSYKLAKSLGKNIVLKQPGELKTLFKSLYEKRVFPLDGETNPYDGAYLYDLYSLFLNSSYNETFEDWMMNNNGDHKPYLMIYEDLFEELSQLKSQYNYVSFDDLLLNMITIQKETNFNFTEILVDEYQDTNPLQGKLLDGFNAKSLFCVGDYDQSIYAFNGSDINIISSFNTRYKEATLHALNKNYRSTKPILDLANKVIQNNDRIYEKSLEVVRTENEHKPMLLAFDELYSQYDYISQNIQNSTTPHNQIAVIYRNNSSADGIEINLRDRNIACKRKGGHSFFDSKEIKVTLDILILIHNANDMMAFIHIIEYGQNIGKAIAKDIFDALNVLGHGSIHQGLLQPDATIKTPFISKKTTNIQLGLFDDFIDIGSLSKFKNSNFHESFLSNAILKHPKLTKEGGEFLYEFYKLYKTLKKMKNPANLIDLITKSDFFKIILNQVANNRARQKDGSINEGFKSRYLSKCTRRLATLKHLSHRHTNIKNFLNAMILGGGELSEGEGVNLLSIHASKGLEFKEVYIIDLMDGRFPNRTLMSKGGSLEEERRLFYVAVTRAKDILYLSYAKYDKIKKLDFIHSPFLVESGLIPKESNNNDTKD